MFFYRLVAIGVDSENEHTKNGENDGFRLNGSDDCDDLNLPELETNQTSLNNGQSSATTTVCFYQSRYRIPIIKMIGVQSCKHFGCQRSQPTIRAPFGCPGRWS